MNIFGNELRFLIACCQSDPSPDDINFINQAINRATVRNEHLPTLSRHHGVLPLVYKTLKERAQNDNPNIQNLLSDFKRHYMTIARRNMLMTAELTTITRRFNELSIDTLLFKGPALAQIAYGDLTLRQFGDLDILVHRKDFRRIARLLTDRGYEPLFPLERYHGEKVLFELNNDCPFYERKRGITIEIHWDFFRKLALPTAAFSPWKHPRTLDFNGVPIQTLSDERHLLYHSLHGSKHIWERLNWIVDIDRFIRNTPELDWEWIVDTAKKMGALRMFLLGPALARHFFATPLPPTIDTLCEKGEFDEIIAFVISEFNRPEPTPEESLVKLKKIVALRDSFYYQALTLLEFIFRPGINERRTLILPDILFPLYWIIRPFGLCYRFLRHFLLNSPKEQEA